jgi:hypothetical protein
MENVTDKLETLILLALDANHTDQKAGTVIRDKSTGGIASLHDQGELLRFEDMRPDSAYTFDMMDKERIFTATPDYLLTHPSEVLGEESEVVMLSGDTLKWRGFRRLRSAPKGVACLGKASHWYEMHTRFVDSSGNGDYCKRLIPIDKTGRPLFAKIQGHIVCAPNKEGEMLVICSSVIEDAHRSNAMLAAVKDATEIKFPVPLGDYKELFSDREGPYSGSRKKAIVHWVAKHLRSSTRGKEHAVKQHTRGIQEFKIDGLRVKLSPNTRLSG